MHRDVFAQIAFDVSLVLNHLTDAVYLFLAQILDLLERIHLRRHQYLQRPRIPNPVDVRQPDPCLLIARKIDACNTCHTVSFVMPRKIIPRRLFRPIPNRSDESLTARCSEPLSPVLGALSPVPVPVGVHRKPYLRLTSPSFPLTNVRRSSAPCFQRHIWFQATGYRLPAFLLPVPCTLPFTPGAAYASRSRRSPAPLPADG